MFENMGEAMWGLLGTSLWETVLMVGVSGVLGSLIGIPLGIYLRLTDKGGVLQNAAAHHIVGWVVNALRSVPFAVQHMLARWSALAATGVAPPADGLLAVLAPIGCAITYQQLVHGPQAWGQGFGWRDLLDADQIWPEHVSEAEDERRWDAMAGGEIRDMWQDWQRVTAERLLAWAPTIRQAAALARPLERREGDAPPRRRGQRPRFDLRGTPSRQMLFSLARLQRASALLSV